MNRLKQIWQWLITLGDGIDKVSKVLHLVGTISILLLGLSHFKTCKQKDKMETVMKTEMVKRDSTQQLLNTCITADSTGTFKRAAKNFHYSNQARNE
jgi:hypothetical protein